MSAPPLELLRPPVDASGVTQTILYDPELNSQGVYGNCLQAAVATLLDLPIEAVPHFAQFLWWPAAITLWARGRGLDTRTVEVDSIPVRRCVLNGWSVRGVAHSVVAENRRVIWDPHPSRDGLEGVVDALFLEPWAHDGDRRCWACNVVRPEDVA